MSNEELDDSFLRRYGCYLVYLVFFVGLFLNGGVAIFHFRDGRWLLGVWALSSIVVLPKATFGLILIAGHESVGPFDIPEILSDIFPRTMRRHDVSKITGYYALGNLLGYNPVLRGVVRESIWLGIGLFPIIAFIFIQQ